MKKTVLFKTLMVLIFSAGAAFTASAAHLGSKLMFSARMNGAQEVPAVNTPAAGVASFILNGERDSLCVNIYMGGFTSNFAGIHLHEGAAGTNGAVLLDLSGYVVNGAVKYVITGAELTPSLIQKMIEGNIYVNAHTSGNMNGEIRGQVKLEQDFGFRATLNGQQEVPAVATNATGLGLFNLSFNKKKMYIWIVGTNLSGTISSAHLHRAAAGANGGVAYDLTSNINGNTIIDTIDVTTVPGFLADLEAGNVYINVHTAANPGGEIRGQLAYNANTIEVDGLLTGGQEVPAVTTSATGTAYFSINSTFTSISYKIQTNGLSGPITGAHLHQGTAGNTGGVVVDLSSNVMPDGTIQGTISGADLTPELIEDMFASKIYLNVHTSANPGGEIRSNLNRLAREGYTVEMNGAQESPAVSTPASGGGIVSISRERDNAHVMLVARDLSANLSGAHIHNAAPGSNGPVVLDISSAFSGTAAFTSAFFYLTREDATPFGPTEELMFRNGMAYVNLHNSQFPNGEIRGDAYRGSKCFAHSLGLDEVENSELGVYPNPANTSITVTMENFNGTQTLTLVDISGKAIRTIEMLSNGQTIDISELKDGVYFLRGNNAVTKIIKK